MLTISAALIWAAGHGISPRSRTRHARGTARALSQSDMSEGTAYPQACAQRRPPTRPPSRSCYRPSRLRFCQRVLEDPVRGDLPEEYACDRTRTGPRMLFLRRYREGVFEILSGESTSACAATWLVNGFVCLQQHWRKINTCRRSAYVRAWAWWGRNALLCIAAQYFSPLSKARWPQVHAFIYPCIHLRGQQSLRFTHPVDHHVRVSRLHCALKAATSNSRPGPTISRLTWTWGSGRHGKDQAPPHPPRLVYS